METNIIRAIINLVNNPIIELKQYSESHNRTNSMGESLEEYIKDIFAGTVNENDMMVRNRKISQCFSYLGNQNNPPDSIINGGDAIEVKKIENKGSFLALNSSYPKTKIFSNSTMITDACRNCETWIEKDIIYTVGIVKNNLLSGLCMVYGEDYAASEGIYTRIKDVISKGVNSIEGVEFSVTNELGRVNKVDPLGITYLRVRGMWGIENPMKVFNYIYRRDESKQLNFMALINQDKYNTLQYTDELERLAREVENLNMLDVEIKEPDNPAKLRPAKLVTFSV
ncbi:NgoPII family restriction endonuclease [Lacrimispora aerotolerans]|uniref:NgoPII family restriction endonuclease n=1 Tax=Lacrimispora aerotolerans TaxID=36832 RepID=UPI00047DA08D|nr:NgoPII family restriction endonuclease [Lacrimispora aerotolerans]